MANNRLASAILTAALAGGLLAGPVRADENLDFYKGKIVRLVNGGAAGSGYDLYSRMLAPWIEKKLGATVIVESRPGAGMMTAMNHVAVAPPDGLTMMLAPGEGAVLAKLVDDPALRFDLEKYGLLARVNTAPRVLIVNPNSPYRTVDDLFKQAKPLQIGANGKTDAASDTSAVFCHALKIQCKITIGYKSSNDFSMAAIRGEVDGTILVEDSSARYAQGGQLRGVVVTARERSRLMPDVPTVYESVKLDPEATWWLDFREDVRKVGRLLIVAARHGARAPRLPAQGGEGGAHRPGGDEGFRGQAATRPLRRSRGDRQDHPQRDEPFAGAAQGGQARHHGEVLLSGRPDGA